MPISWTEIKQRAIQFAREWEGETNERAEAKTFWDEFFQVFGIRRRLVASFEEPVKTIKGTYGYIDLFWKGTLLAEHKSAGRSLDKAHSQAMNYIQSLRNEGRGDDAPRYVLVSDFRSIALHDLDEDRTVSFPLSQLHRHVHDFAFVPGYKQHTFEDQDPVNLKAVDLMGRLHDALEDGGYAGHPFERFLVRILFCLFADDTGIFERNTFAQLVEQTRPDGSDLGPLLARLFEVLNTPVEQRQKSLDETMATLPYVNGGLFEEHLPFADLNGLMRDALIMCSRFDWSRISPAIFGSLFQSVMEPRERRQAGGHYTSERDILKVIRPLFMDQLRAEFERAKRKRIDLEAFHDRLGRIRLLDPACGCGNFLVVSYRELRLLELDVLKCQFSVYHKGDQSVGIDQMSRVDVDAMNGVELNEFPARIAEVAMWLMDHQMNLKLSEEFGQYYVRLPLRKSARIVVGNALRMDWHEVIPPSTAEDKLVQMVPGERPLVEVACTHVLGNPPFVGAKLQTPEQRDDLSSVTEGVPGAGLLDYVAGWYFKAADYVRGTRVPVAFVSTNSISQGEQVGVLWNALFQRGMKIHFAHRTFPWESEARGKAHVHVVIIGFGARERQPRLIFDYEANLQAATICEVANISPYLVEGPDVAILNREYPLCNVPKIGIGNKPIDDGNYLFTASEKAEFIQKEPASADFFLPWTGAEEFIQRKERWCLWLGDCPPDRLRRMPHAMKRVEAVKEFRLQSKSAPTQKLAATPTRFHVENMPKGTYLLIPSVSSERRSYIPMGFMPEHVITSNLCLIVPAASMYHFGVLTSTMHMAWVRLIGGRLKSDYRYSAKLVYNNFPWPDGPSDKQRSAVVWAAQHVLDARDSYPNSSLADLYDPVTMPPVLVKAHLALDRAVDQCYRPQPFPNDRARVEFLFGQYERLISPFVASAKTGNRKARA